MAMIWLQAGVSFMAWIAYGAWLQRRQQVLRQRMVASSRRKRVLLGSAGLIGGAVLLLAGLAVIGSLGGVFKGSLTAWAWLAVTLLGIGFVHTQVMGAAAILTIVLEENQAAQQASQRYEQEKTE